MRGKNIITINGRQYDAVTGMPISAAAIQPAAPTKPQAHQHKGSVMSDVGPRPAKAVAQPIATKLVATQKPTQRTASPQSSADHVHRRPQRSQTLRRTALKRPEPQHHNAHTTQRSDMISRFAPSHSKTPASVPKPVQKSATMDVQPAKPTAHSHSTVVAAHQAVTKKHEAKPEQLHGKELKEHLIKNQLDKHHDEKKAHATHKAKKERLSNRRTRVATVLSSVAALVLLGGYLTYLNLPSLSIRVAAARANVDASYPSYQPAGYSFTGPVAFSPGEVRIQFRSNTNDYNYSLVQRSSSWNSQAVLDNYVKQETKQYATLQERGLTIYLMENKAAWVNGGTLYVIDGNAPLSGEQIQKIASSTL